MPRKMPNRLDLIRKHEQAIKELAKAGIVPAHLAILPECYERVGEVGVRKTAKEYKVSKTAIYKRIYYLETEI